MVSLMGVGRLRRVTGCIPFLALGACPTLQKWHFLGVSEPFIVWRSLILSQMFASDFSRFLMSDRLLAHSFV